MSITKDIVEDEHTNHSISSKSKKRSEETKNTSKLGLPDGWSRTTLAVREKHLNKLKDLARLERTTVKDALDQILDRALSSYNFDSIFNAWKNRHAEKP